MRSTLCLLTILIAAVSAADQSNQDVTLKDAFQNCFYIGAAVSDAQISGKNEKASALIKSQFNSITPENCMKWDTIHPQPNIYNFEQADRFVEFGQKNNMFIVGHILIDIDQVPDWVFQDAQGKKVDRQTLLDRMHEHITSVVSRYKGRVNAWHVVNEAVGRDGELLNSKWRQIIGDDYILKAFECAHKADPNVELYYNGQDILTNPAIDSIIRLASDIEKSSRIDGIGIQAHWSLVHPSAEQVEQGIIRLAHSGLKMMITEMDITVLPRNNNGKDLNPYPDGLPKKLQRKLADRYAELFSIFCKHSFSIDRVNLWGLDDGQSWLNYWPVNGRTDYPLLFDRDLQPKPAYFAVIKTAEKYNK